MVVRILGTGCSSAMNCTKESLPQQASRCIYNYYAEWLYWLDVFL